MFPPVVPYELFSSDEMISLIITLSDLDSLATQKEYFYCEKTGSLKRHVETFSPLTLKAEKIEL